MTRCLRLSALRALLALASWLSLALPSRAYAQEYLPAASAHIASGIEGGGRGFQRSRTRLRLALELRVDEAPENALVVGGIFDIEPHTSFGGELRYVRTVSPLVAVGAGAIGYFVPAILIGPCAGVEVRIPILKKTYFAVGPEVAVFAFGSDLPDRTVIWQALFQGGFRVDL
jgi:hypothetical protein